MSHAHHNIESNALYGERHMLTTILNQMLCIVHVTCPPQFESNVYRKRHMLTTTLKQMFCIINVTCPPQLWIKCCLS